MRIAIIGAGIGGLSLAIALRVHGLQAPVYERAAVLEPVGAGITLWPNAIRALRELGVADSVIDRGQRIDRGHLRDDRGRVIATSNPGEIEARFGEPTIAIHRAELHDILLSALPEDSIRLDHSCSTADPETGEVEFTNGRSVRADLIVGADGIHSVVRRVIRPDLQPRYSGYAAWRGVVEAPEHVRSGISGESWGRGQRFGIVPIDSRRIYWFATANVSEGRRLTSNESRTELLNRFAGWHTPIADLIGRTAPDALLYNDLHDLEPSRNWSKGSIVLLGDAIHATTPNLGQGACMAIESAVVLARRLAEQPQSIPQALQRYEQERSERVKWITNQSRQIGMLGQIESRAGCLLRNALLRLAPDSLAKRQMMKAAAYEV